MDVTLGTIYEDVAELQAKVAQLEAQMAQIGTLGLVELTEGADLYSLDVGMYYIPNDTVCASLLNKPTASTSTAFVNVVRGVDSGQKMIYYMPCALSASFYYNPYYTGSWKGWKEINLVDSGWIDLALSGSVTVYNEEQRPRYRRVGDTVFLSGVVKNIAEYDTVIATLPSGYRPSKKVIMAIPSTGTKFSRMSIQTSGVITYEQINDNAPSASYWHSLACAFHVD